MHALALYSLLVYETKHDGKTAGALTNTQKVVSILAAVHKDLGVRRIKVHMYAFLSFLLSVSFCFPSILFFFVWHVIEGEGWRWSDLVHAYPQNERTVLLTFLISSLFPPFHPLGDERGASSIQN